MRAARFLLDGLGRPSYSPTAHEQARPEVRGSHLHRPFDMPSRPRRSLQAVAFVAAGLTLPAATASTSTAVTVESKPRVAAVSPAAANHPERRVQNEGTRVVGVGERAAVLALRMVGTPYRWGGESPGGFDCSGLIRWAYGRFGIELPHSSTALYEVGRTVSSTELRSGDVLFFTGLGHVGLYLGGGLMVHAPYSGKSVELVNLEASHYGGRLIGARRVVGS
jgi:cell wall-associated NlpC family hydrolase